MWIESAKLNLEIRGPEAAVTVLFVHGAGGESSQWSAAADILSANFRVAALDLSGHGESPRKGDPHTIDTYIADILAAVDAMGGGPVVLCGHSMGGALVIETCLARPDVVRALVLANTGARLRVFPALFDMLKNDYTSAVNTMAQFAFRTGTPENLVGDYKTRLRKAVPDVVYQDFAICDKFNVMEQIGGVSAPALIVVGDKDQLTPVKYSEWLHANIPGSALRVVPGSGHMTMLEATDEFARVVGEFLSGL